MDGICICEGVGDDSRYGAWHVDNHIDMNVLYECVRMCVSLWHCTCTWVGSSPGRRISLLGVAHPVVEKSFQVLEVHWAMSLTQDPSHEEKG